MKTYIGNNNNNNFGAIGSNSAWKILGLGGDDNLQGGNKADIIYGHEGNDRLDGGGGDDELLGGIGNDSLYGGANNDKLGGEDGNDFLDGQAGDDVMAGGLGNDIMVVDSLGDRTVERPGEGIDFVQTSLSNYALERGNEVEVLIFLETAGAAVGSGNQFDNSIVGNAYKNTLSGEEGNDRISGYAGDDLLQGGIGDDSLYGGAGDDFLAGGLGDDSLYGGAGNDFLAGGPGDDSLYGEAGNDRYTVNSAGDIVVENVDEGDYDRVDAFVSYSLENSENVEELFLVEGSTATNGTGNNGDNFLVGNSANNTLRGLMGSDTLLGEGGNDILVGTTGGTNLREIDLLDGGAGSDIFVLGEANKSYYYAGEGYALITDFTILEGNILESDRIQLRGDFSNYELRRESSAGIGSEAQDTLILRNNDIIGIIQDQAVYDINSQNGFVRV